MTKSAQLLLFALLGLAFFAFSPDSNTALAQGTLTGEWRASVDSAKSAKWNKSDKWDKKSDADDSSDVDDRDDKADRVNNLYLSFERRTERGGRSNMGS